jgi:hypothetical protein
MPAVLLCRASFPEALFSLFYWSLLRVKPDGFSDAISLSVALNRPARRVGGTTDSSVSSFTEGSARVYTSVVCMLACPSHRDTFRRSFVACKIKTADVCRSRCGNTRFVESDGQRLIAVSTCLCKMYSKPERVIASPRALRNNSGVAAVPLRANHARSATVVSFHSGRQRSRRPLPCTRTLAWGWCPFCTRA